MNLLKNILQGSAPARTDVTRHRSSSATVASRLARLAAVAFCFGSRQPEIRSQTSEFRGQTSDLRPPASGLRPLLLILSILFILSPPARAAYISYAFTNYLGVAITNESKIQKVGDTLADGSAIPQGLPIRVRPASDGRATNWLEAGNYTVTNTAGTGGLIYFQVPDDNGPTVYSFIQPGVWKSGGNFFNTFFGTNPPPTSVQISNALGYPPVNPTNLNYFGANDTNFALLIGANGSNYTRLFGANGTNDSLSKFQTGSNFSLTIGGNDSNYTRLFGANGSNNDLAMFQTGSNFSLTVGGNDSNYTRLFGANGTNDSLSKFQTGSNFSLTIGGNGSNYTRLFGANGSNNDLVMFQTGSNFSLSIGGNDSNYTRLFGANGTNDSLSKFQTGSNFSLTIGANGSNYTRLFGANGSNNDLVMFQTGSNFSLSIGGNDSNYTRLFGANGTNDSLSKFQTGSNFSLTIGANGSNYTRLFGANGSNNNLATFQAASNAVGTLINSSNYTTVPVATTIADTEIATFAATGRVANANALAPTNWAAQATVYGGGGVITNGGKIYDGFGFKSADLNNSRLFDESGNAVLDWLQSLLLSESGEESIDWQSRTLLSSTSIITADWNARQLFGTWAINGPLISNVPPAGVTGLPAALSALSNQVAYLEWQIGNDAGSLLVNLAGVTGVRGTNLWNGTAFTNNGLICLNYTNLTGQSILTNGTFGSQIFYGPILSYASASGFPNGPWTNIAGVDPKPVTSLFPLTNAPGANITLTRYLGVTTIASTGGSGGSATNITVTNILGQVSGVVTNFGPGLTNINFSFAGLVILTNIINANLTSPTNGISSATASNIAANVANAVYSNNPAGYVPTNSVKFLVDGPLQTGFDGSLLTAVPGTTMSSADGSISYANTRNGNGTTNYASTLTTNINQTAGANILSTNTSPAMTNEIQGIVGAQIVTTNTGADFTNRVRGIASGAASNAIPLLNGTGTNTTLVGSPNITVTNINVVTDTWLNNSNLHFSAANAGGGIIYPVPTIIISGAGPYQNGAQPASAVNGTYTAIASYLTNDMGLFVYSNTSPASSLSPSNYFQIYYNGGNFWKLIYFTNSTQSSFYDNDHTTNKPSSGLSVSVPPYAPVTNPVSTWTFYQQGQAGTVSNGVNVLTITNSLAINTTNAGAYDINLQGSLNASSLTASDISSSNNIDAASFTIAGVPLVIPTNLLPVITALYVTNCFGAATNYNGIYGKTAGGWWTNAVTAWAIIPRGIAQQYNYNMMVTNFTASNTNNFTVSAQYPVEVKFGASLIGVYPIEYGFPHTGSSPLVSVYSYNTNSAVTNLTTAQITQLNAAVTNISVGNTVFADSIFGTNATALRQRQDKPSLTISNALAMSRVGDLINCIGVFREANLTGTNGVNFCFPAGSGISNGVTTLNLFGDTPNSNAGAEIRAITNSVTGYGDFINDAETGDGNYPGLLGLSDSNSVFYFSGNSFIHTDPNSDSTGIVINHCKYFNLHLKLIDYEQDFGNDQANETPIIWNGGRADMFVDTIIARGLVSCFGVYDNNDSQFSDPSIMTFHSGFLSATNSTANCCWWYGSQKTNQQQYFYVDVMQSGTGAAIFNLLGGGGKIYFPATSKASNSSSTSPVIDFQGAEAKDQLWYNGQKVTANGLGGSGFGLVRFNGTAVGNLTNAADVVFDVAEWQIPGTNFQTAFQLEYGTYVFTGHKPLVIPNGRGFQLSRCKATVWNQDIDCSASATAMCNPISITNSCNLTLNNCNLTAAIGVPCITSTVPVTVWMNGGSLNTFVSANVTLIRNNATNSPITLLATGGTNTFGGNGVAYVTATAVAFTIKDKAGNTLYTSPVLTATVSAALQPGWFINAASGLAGTILPNP